MKAILCTCCGAELTAPQFHNGHPYGYTCVQRFNVKPFKDTGLWVVADKIEEFVDEKTGTKKVRAYLGKRKFVEAFFKRVTKEGLVEDTNFIKGGLIKVAQYKSGAKSIWKRLEVIKKYLPNGKVSPVSILDEINNETILTF